MSIKINLPEDVKIIIETLYANGYEAFAVGGCVRDSLLGREPGDWDITTSALPQQVKALFRRTIDTGLEHGTVTVMLGKNGYEVTTYRIDGEYDDARHPKSVEFTGNLKKDLERRDFTINAMAYNDVCGIVDEFGGIADLDNKLIRCVGKATDRFGEDALRILRAVRFSAQLGFEIEEETIKAIKELAHTLEKISKERIHTEFNKMLKSAHPEYFERAAELGITKAVMQEYDLLSKEQKAFSSIFVRLAENELPERYAALTFKQGSEAAVRLLRELKMDNNTITLTERLVKHLHTELTQDEAKLRHIIHNIGEDIFLRLMSFRIAYEKAMEKSGNAADIQGAVDQYNLAEKIIRRGDCLSLKSLALNGKDLMEMGIPAGREVGRILNLMLHKVLTDQSLNTKNKLISEVNKLK